MSWIDELIEEKISGVEKERLDASTLPFHRQQYERLIDLLRQSHQNTQLPETAEGKTALNDLLLRIRLGSDFNQKEDFAAIGLKG